MGMWGGGEGGRREATVPLEVERRSQMIWMWFSKRRGVSRMNMADILYLSLFSVYFLPNYYIKSILDYSLALSFPMGTFYGNISTYSSNVR